ncbi:hypothetical protein Calkr_1837 [Caldicellulosiruptor acetigenus I77R1B]|uniref:Uncharacterized protein n=1 Tax=Caldicellulosiruptor acetigenus (strain ATCC 700853 / DSM 12137 / I77R1B) TaxID=632335 RepID=E4S454_CALA7|nr:hypothetical protein [Caldicellulosiruptor acetigenus]ADQ41321.1 hypothetical protein Calkr_1837 [Caldicellulosiruptor acetigenus I77R1B]
MKKDKVFLSLVIVFLLLHISTFTCIGTNLSNEHNSEVNILQRQCLANSWLNLYINNLTINKDSTALQSLNKITNINGSYDTEKFKLSKEYEYYRVFHIPTEVKIAENGRPYHIVRDEVKDKIKNLRFNSWRDVLNTEFVDKGWARIVYYDNIPVGYLLIEWDSKMNNYIVNTGVFGDDSLGNAVENLERYLAQRGMKSDVKIVNIEEMRLYAVSGDGNWWCAGAKGYENHIWDFGIIKDALNEKPMQILKTIEETSRLMREAPEKIMMGGEDPSKTLYFAAAKKERTQNAMIAIFLLILTAIIVICSKWKFSYQYQFRKHVKNTQK